METVPVVHCEVSQTGQLAERAADSESAGTGLGPLSPIATRWQVDKSETGQE